MLTSFTSLALHNSHRVAHAAYPTFSLPAFALATLNLECFANIDAPNFYVSVVRQKQYKIV